MTLSPWTIYVILQLDSLRGLLLAFSIITCVITAGWLIAYLATRCAIEDTTTSVVNRRVFSRRIPFIIRNVRGWSIAAVVAVTATVACPSTRTAALTYLLPKVLSSDAIKTVSTDTAELYQLLLDRVKTELKSAAEDEPSLPEAPIDN